MLKLLRLLTCCCTNYCKSKSRSYKIASETYMKYKIATDRLSDERDIKEILEKLRIGLFDLHLNYRPWQRMAANFSRRFVITGNDTRLRRRFKQEHDREESVYAAHDWTK